MPVTEKKSIAERLLQGDRNAVARLITWAENGDARFPRALELIYPEVGRARRWGITGPPGVGKSTLVNELIIRLRKAERTVGVLAVDPSSPFSGGALLGDRIRMDGHPADSGVFIRSMASRGHLGGLAEATGDALAILDAAGFDVVIVETVGAGQNEVEVQALAHTVVLVLMPGSGDAIQAIKAGVMEIPDVIVINKCDRPGADILAGEVESALTLVPPDGWVPPVILTQALEGQGVEEAWAAVERHQENLRQSGRADERARDGMRRHLTSLALERLARDLAERIDDARLDALADQVVGRQVDPATAVDSILGTTTSEEA